MDHKLSSFIGSNMLRAKFASFTPSFSHKRERKNIGDLKAQTLTIYSSLVLVNHVQITCTN